MLFVREEKWMWSVNNHVCDRRGETCLVGGREFGIAGSSDLFRKRDVRFVSPVARNVCVGTRSVVRRS